MSAKLGFDTQAIIDMTRNLQSLLNINNDWKLQYYSFVICVKSCTEAVDVLMNKFNSEEQEAENEVDKVLNGLGIKPDPCSPQDESKSLQLENKYKSLKFHYPDSKILAHYIRINVKALIVRDGIFEKVAKLEGLTVYRPPTVNSTIDRRLRELFGHRR